MNFISLRGNSAAVPLSQAIRDGLAPDGGLYVPERWPSVSFDESWLEDGFALFAARLLRPFFEVDALAPRLQEICSKAFDFPVVLKSLDAAAGKAVLELFHGPTGAFKDFGARFLALSMDAMNEARASQPSATNDKVSGDSRLVLVATSGDTGGAVAAAFCACTRIPVAILYPKTGVSQRQEKQLTVWGEQVRAFAVDGSFDDCQRVVKDALSSQDWKNKHKLISANSINVARLLPQMAYFAFASLLYRKEHRTTARLVIPSGNMGNASAALWAQKLGFPIRQVIFAHNANRAVPDYFQTGLWQPQPTINTLANAMDVGNPSNFDRVRGLFASDTDPGALERRADAVSVSDQEISETILFAKAEWNEIICPHTATAIFAAEKLTDPHWIVAATAHPAKFEKILEPILGLELPVPPALQRLLDREGRSTAIAPSLRSFTEHWSQGRDQR